MPDYLTHTLRIAHIAVGCGRHNFIGRVRNLGDIYRMYIFEKYQ